MGTSSMNGVNGRVVLRSIRTCTQHPVQNATEREKDLARGLTSSKTSVMTAPCANSKTVLPRNAVGLLYQNCGLFPTYFTIYRFFITIQ